MSAADEGAGRPYGGRLPEERKAQRRRQLLDAALELYGTVGIQRSSVAQICRLARVAPAKFYEVYDSQHDLLNDLCNDILDAQLELVTQAIADAPATLEGRVRPAIQAYCHALLDDRRRARLICIEYPGSSPQAELNRHEQVLWFARLVLEEFTAIAGEDLPYDRAHMLVLATALVGGCHEAIGQWLIDPDPIPIDELVDVVCVFFISVGSHLLTEIDARRQST